MKKQKQLKKSLKLLKRVKEISWAMSCDWGVMEEYEEWKKILHKIDELLAGEPIEKDIMGEVFTMASKRMIHDMEQQQKFEKEKK